MPRRERHFLFIILLFLGSYTVKIRFKFAVSLVVQRDAAGRTGGALPQVSCLDFYDAGAGLATGPFGFGPNWLSGPLSVTI